jgi:prepilin-type processing-associated H-X9-DG protein
MCSNGSTRNFKSTVYNNPRGVTTSSGSFTSCLVGWIQAPSFPLASTNYWSWALARNPTDPQFTDCASGKTPLEYFNGIKWLPGPGNIHLVGDKLDYRKVGEILADAYDPGVKFWAHRGGHNVLYYDGRVMWREDARSN